MSICPTILIVEDEKNSREGLQQYLGALDYDVITAESGETGWQQYKEKKPDIILTDIRMPGTSGIDLLERIVSDNPSAIIILITAYGSVEDAVKAMKKGAFYYLTKPVNFEELEFLIKKSLTSLYLEQENRELRRDLFKEKFEKGEITAHAPKMIDLLKTVEQIAHSHATVLIEGESGTGKELIAHRIHDLSARHDKPFIAVHCAALTETLLSSELFGHEKGSFTGAIERKIGRFERANEGTLFLDEIGEISADTQVRLLRVLQENEFERVGGTRTIKVNVRILCATNKNLIAEVKAGRFREDLYYRLNVIYLKVPPLRERKEDIPPLTESFIKHFSLLNGKKIQGIEKDAMDALSRYPWPGNVRELKNIMERMVVLSRNGYLTIRNIPEEIKSSVNVTEASDVRNGAFMSLADMEKRMIQKALMGTAGNKSTAAKKLGISRRTLYRKMEGYQLTD